jgi:hypothetical protein
MKCALVFPPYFITFQPYSSLPVLSAYLAQKGHTVVKADENIDFITDSLTVRALSDIRERAFALFRELAAKPKPTERELFLLRYITGCFKDEFFNLVLPEIENALETIRNPEKMRQRLVANRARDVVLKAQNLVLQDLRLQTVLRTGKTDFSKCLSWDEIEREIVTDSAYARYFREKTIPALEKAAPGVIGVSVIVEDQLVPAFILAHELKNSPLRKKVHLVFGGPVITILKKVLAGTKGPFELVDSFGLFEGEQTLDALLTVLETSGDLAQVPNLLYMKDGNPVETPKKMLAGLDSLPTPDYSGLALEKYLSPVFVPMMKVSRGCYWNKCGFCNNRYLTSGAPHRRRSAQKVFADFEQLNALHGVNCFALWDEAVPPRLLEGLAGLVEKSGRNFKWFAEVRFEKVFTLDFLQKLYAGGCRALTFGLETGSPRMQRHMNKCYDIAVCETILKDCARVGIRVYMCLMVGFPGELPADVMDTMDFLDRNSRTVFHAGVSHFGVRRFTDVYNRPEKYGVIIEDDSESFSSTGDVNYQVKKGFGMPLAQSNFFYTQLQKKLTQMGLMQNEPETHYLVRC